MAKKAQIKIADALIRMLETTSLEEITIKELAGEAGVSRMSFYRYFLEKRDVLAFYMEYILGLYMEQEKKSRKAFRSVDHIAESLSFFGQYKKFALVLYKTGMGGIMLDAVNEYIRVRAKQNKDDELKMYASYFYAGALYNIYMKWILDGEKIDVEALSAMIHKWKP